MGADNSFWIAIVQCFSSLCIFEFVCICFFKKNWFRIATLGSAWNSTKTCSASRANGWTRCSIAVINFGGQIFVAQKLSSEPLKQTEAVSKTSMLQGITLHLLGTLNNHWLFHLDDSKSLRIKLFVSPFPSIWPNYNISPGFPWNFRRFPETLVTFQGGVVWGCHPPSHFCCLQFGPQSQCSAQSCHRAPRSLPGGSCKIRCKGLPKSGPTIPNHLYYYTYVWDPSGRNLSLNEKSVLSSCRAEFLPAGENLILWPQGSIKGLFTCHPPCAAALLLRCNPPLLSRSFLTLTSSDFSGELITPKLICSLFWIKDLDISWQLVPIR